MKRIGRIIAFALFWAAVIAAFVLVGRTSSEKRKLQTVGGMDIEITDSSRISLANEADVRRWISAAGIRTEGIKCSEAPLGQIERVILAHGFVRSAECYLTSDCRIRVEISQHRPVLRMMLEGGYDFYLTDRGEVFRAPEMAAVYVPVVTGRFDVPFPADFEGVSNTVLLARKAEIDKRIDEIREEQNLLRIERRRIARARSRVKGRQIERGFWESKEDFAVRVKSEKQTRSDSLALLRWRDRDRLARIEQKDKLIESEVARQKKLEKNYEDFINLTNFVKLIESDDFWRAQIVEFVVSQAQNGSLELRLIPRAGAHTIIFGRIEDVEAKLDKLLLFYRRVLNKEGWERYRTIDIRFADQVVCTR